MCRLVFISYADQFARTIALTVTMQTNLARTYVRTYVGNGKLDGTRSLPAISASVFRANESASPSAPIANSNSNHAPLSVRLRAAIKLCTGIYTPVPPESKHIRKSPTFREILRLQHGRIDFVCRIVSSFLSLTLQQFPVSASNSFVQVYRAEFVLTCPIRSFLLDDLDCKISQVSGDRPTLRHEFVND